jgi:hypothetical protein
MTTLIEYDGHLWEIESIEGEKVKLKAPHNYLVFNKAQSSRIVTKKELELPETKNIKNGNDK